MAEVLLQMEKLEKVFGGVRAVSDLDGYVNSGELVGLIGPNGSGKTTTLNLVSGVLAPSGGRIRFRGKDIGGDAPADNARLGMCRTFQNIRLFPDLSVADNVAVGLHMRHGAGLIAGLLALPAARKAEREIRVRAREALATVGLADRAEDLISNLPYGDQRLVEIARALATEPVLLLLDEPAAGMNPQETQQLGETIRALNRDLGLAVLLVEHDMKLVMSICERLIVINHGQLLASGTPQEVSANPEVVAAYLGSGKRRREASHA